MLRAALSIVLLCCAPAFAADNFTGTYTARNPQGNVVTLTLKQDAQGKVSGTLSGQGLTFTVEGEARPEGLIGTLTGDGGMLFLVSRLRGAELDVMLAEPSPSGQPNMEATRQFVMTRDAPKKPAAAAKPSTPDQQAVQFLTANAWCAFSFNQRSGTSTKERVVFRPDGTVTSQGGAETYSSGPSGTVSGQHSSGNQARWRVQGGNLEMSADGATWVPQPLRVTRNSNGAPILNSGGKEYMICQ